jgi:hypothetical protein
MSIHVAIHHRTTYRYDRLVALGPQSVRLRPAPHCRSRILAYSLKVLPDPHFINWQQDPQSNYIARLVFPQRTKELSIEVDLVAEMAAMNPFDFFLEPHAEKWPFEYERVVRPRQLAKTGTRGLVGLPREAREPCSVSGTTDPFWMAPGIARAILSAVREGEYVFGLCALVDGRAGLGAGSLAAGSLSSTPPNTRLNQLTSVSVQRIVCGEAAGNARELVEDGALFGCADSKSTKCRDPSGRHRLAGGPSKVHDDHSEEHEH